MTDRVQNEPPRRKGLRLREYDYATPGAYFVTVCAHERKFLFGRVVDQVMRLNVLGRIVERCWFDLRAHYPRIELENFVVMPNHVHGIVVLKPPLAASDRIHPLPEIVRGFKTFSSRAANAIRRRTEPLWQRGFHDRIVRDESELARIREYIDNNPAVWRLDRENPDLPPAVKPAEAGLASGGARVPRRQGRV